MNESSFIQGFFVCFVFGFLVCLFVFEKAKQLIDEKEEEKNDFM